MELGVHDLVTLNNDETPEEGYERTKRFVKEIEGLNYKRYWFAEHHGSQEHASSSPELMAAYMSAITEKLRLGTGGTMIMHYSPLKIAENFKTLTTLAPNRIDLGLGRAPGGGPDEINYLDNHYKKRFLIKGTPEHVEKILADEIETIDIDELMVYAPIFEENARVQSYKHLAKIFNKI